MTKPEINQVLKLFKKLAILIVVLFIVDRTIGTLIEHAYDTTPPPDAKQFDYSINKIKEDVIIFGSSRAAHCYVSNIFTDTLGMPTYNCGKDRTNILYSDIVLKTMMKRHIPKVVILDVHAKEFSSAAEEGSKLTLAPMVIPYVSKDTALAKVAKRIFPTAVMSSKISKIHAYNSQILPLLIAALGLKKDKLSELHGYTPIFGKRKVAAPQKVDLGDDQFAFDTSGLKRFRDFVKIAKENNIKLFVIQSPMYVVPFESTRSLDSIKAICARTDFPFLNYGFDQELYKQDLFHDAVHLNDKGAKIFTRKLASDIKKRLNDQKTLSKL